MQLDRVALGVYLRCCSVWRGFLMKRQLAAFAACVLMGAPLAGAAEDGVPEQIMRDGMERIVGRLPRDPLIIDQCTRFGAEAMRTYQRLREDGRGAEAMTVISEDMQPQLAEAGLYVCGIYALSNTLRLSPEQRAANEAALPVAVAMNWASASAVPFGDDATGAVYFASATASTLYGMPPSSTEPVFCIAARNDLTEAVDVLKAWPTPSDCVKPAMDGSEAPSETPGQASEPSGDDAPEPVIIASVQAVPAADSDEGDTPVQELPEVARSEVSAPSTDTESATETATDTGPRPASAPAVEAEENTTEEAPEPLVSTEELNQAVLNGEDVAALAASRSDAGGTPEPSEVREDESALVDDTVSGTEDVVDGPDIYAVEGIPEGAPPPARSAAFGAPPAQRPPMQVDAPRDGLSDCQAFFKNYWTDAGTIVQIQDTFCRTSDGDYVQVSSDYRVIE